MAKKLKSLSGKKKRGPGVPEGKKRLATAAGIAKRLGVHRGTVSRALRRVPGGASKRVGHYFQVPASKQAQLRKVMRNK